MEQSSLSELVCALEHGTKIHICIAFYGNCGNRYTHRAYSQMIHNSPVCMEAKTTQDGLTDCYRCRRVTERLLRQRQKSFSGYCAKGVFEYCKPIMYDDHMVGVIFIGNILTADPEQRQRLLKFVDLGFWDSMEQNYTEEDCARTAEILHSYITFLLDKYGNENRNYDPLLENIKNYIREHMAYNVSLTELAEVFNYNEKYLGQLFKARCGYTIKGYCNYIRIKRAKNLLIDTKISVSKISQQLGYSNVTYFDRVFRHFTGVSPQVYRTSGKQKYQA